MTLRIYADFNGLVGSPRDPGRTAVVLDTFGSALDLADAGVALVEGLPLIGVDWSDDVEDLEGHGVAVYDRDRCWWVIEFDEEGVRYVPAGDRTAPRERRCLRCRRDIGVRPNGGGMVVPVGVVPGCPWCGTSIDAALRPPE